MNCSVWNCDRNRRKHAKEGVKFHRFPKDPAIRAEWIRLCVRTGEDVALFEVKDSTRVCSDHFPQGKAKVAQLPVVQEDRLLPSRFWKCRKKKENENILIAPQNPPETDDKSKDPVAEIGLSRNESKDHCRICLRVVAPTVLQRITKQLNEKILKIFAFNFTLNDSEFLICENCVNLMDICTEFHRAVVKANELQSRLKQNVRLDRYLFWNNMKHVQTITQCKDIVLQHSKAIDELCEEEEKMVPTTSDLITDFVPTDAGNEPPISKTIIDQIMETEGGDSSDISIKCETVSEADLTFDQRIFAEALEAIPATPTEPDQAKEQLPDDDFAWPMDEDSDAVFNLPPSKVPTKPKNKRPMSDELKTRLDKGYKFKVPVYVAGLCDICGKYTNRNQTEDHKNRHLGVKPYSCHYRDCETTFYSRYGMMKHLARWHDKVPDVRECDVCGMKIKGGDWYFRCHQKTHLERRERNFPCPLCDLSFFAGHTLKKHIERHRESSRFVSNGLSRLKK